jgi:hypothetical protein
MDNEEYINKITLEFLLNPALHEKLIKNSESNLNLEKDIKFYRKRICQITKDMSRDIFVEETIKPAFLAYATTLIYYFKQLDEKDIFQKEYDDLIDKPVQSDISMNICQQNLDNLLLNIPESVNNLDMFVKKINMNTQQKIIPQYKVANIKDPSLKIKGVKKKNLT